MNPKSYEMNPIEGFYIPEDIAVYTETAINFESDIPHAFLRLAERINSSEISRNCYGIITQEKDGLKYLAAIELKKEDEYPSLDKFIIHRGDYFSIRIDDWKQKLLTIGPTFDQLLKLAEIDRAYPCIEYYESNSIMRCLVRKL